MMMVETAMALDAELDMLDPKPAKKSTKKRGNPERLLQVQVVSYLRRALPDGNIVFSIENERHATGKGFVAARFQAARKASGIVSGIPDLCCIIPGYPCVWIEMKAERGRLSDNQHHAHERMRKAGQIVGVARSIEDAVAIMDEAGVPLRFRLTGA
jgi:hypothetical protein